MFSTFGAHASCSHAASWRRSSFTYLVLVNAMRRPLLHAARAIGGIAPPEATPSRTRAIPPEARIGLALRLRSLRQRTLMHNTQTHIDRSSSSRQVVVATSSPTNPRLDSLNDNSA